MLIGGLWSRINLLPWQLLVELEIVWSLLRDVLHPASFVKRTTDSDQVDATLDHIQSEVKVAQPSCVPCLNFSSDVWISTLIFTCSFITVVQVFYWALVYCG